MVHTEKRHAGVQVTAYDVIESMPWWRAFTLGGPRADLATLYVPPCLDAHKYNHVVTRVFADDMGRVAAAYARTDENGNPEDGVLTWEGAAGCEFIPMIVPEVLSCTPAAALESIAGFAADGDLGRRLYRTTTSRT